MFTIYKTYSRKVFLFLVSKTNNEQLVEELTQETFFQAVQCIERFEGVVICVSYFLIIVLIKKMICKKRV